MPSGRRRRSAGSPLPKLKRQPSYSSRASVPSSSRRRLATPRQRPPGARRAVDAARRRIRRQRRSTCSVFVEEYSNRSRRPRMKSRAKANGSRLARRAPWRSPRRPRRDRPPARGDRVDARRAHGRDSDGGVAAGKRCGRESRALAVAPDADPHLRGERGRELDGQRLHQPSIAGSSAKASRRGSGGWHIVDAEVGGTNTPPSGAAIASPTFAGPGAERIAGHGDPCSMVSDSWRRLVTAHAAVGGAAPRHRSRCPTISRPSGCGAIALARGAFEPEMRPSGPTMRTCGPSSTAKPPPGSAATSCGASRTAAVARPTVAGPALARDAARARGARLPATVRTIGRRGRSGAREPAGPGSAIEDAAGGVDVDGRRAHRSARRPPARRRPCSAARSVPPAIATGARSGAARRIPAARDAPGTAATSSVAAGRVGQSAGPLSDQGRRDGDEAPVAQGVDRRRRPRARRLPSGTGGERDRRLRGCSASAASTPRRAAVPAPMPVQRVRRRGLRRPGRRPARPAPRSARDGAPPPHLRVAVAGRPQAQGARTPQPGSKLPAELRPRRPWLGGPEAADRAPSRPNRWPAPVSGRRSRAWMPCMTSIGSRTGCAERRCPTRRPQGDRGSASTGSSSSVPPGGERARLVLGERGRGARRRSRPRAPDWRSVRSTRGLRSSSRRTV